MFAGDVYKLLEGTADAAFVVAPEGEVCFWNSAAEQLFGYSASDVLDKRCYSILQGEDALGTIVCMGEGSVQHCAAHGRPIPAFDRRNAVPHPNCSSERADLRQRKPRLSRICQSADVVGDGLQ
jgi:PAS domain-containing protein